MLTATERNAAVLATGILLAAVVVLAMTHHLAEVLDRAPYGFGALWLVIAILYSEVSDWWGKRGA
jgi:hypothetical protein